MPTNDANNIRMGAMQYTDDILRNLEISISHAMDSAKARHENYMSSLQEFYDVVSSNRAELNPTAEDAVSDSTENLPKIDISSDMLNKNTLTATASRKVQNVRSSFTRQYFFMEREVPFTMEDVWAIPLNPPKAVAAIARYIWFEYSSLC